MTEGMPTLIAQTFSPSVTTAVLREYQFVSHSIAQLLRDLERHHAERAALHRALMANDDFPNRIHPVYVEFRRRMQQDDSPLSNDIPPSSPVTAPQASSQTSSSSSNPSLTIEIKSEFSQVTSENPAENSSPSYHTVPDDELNHWNPSLWGLPNHEPGTRNHPIDVDQIPDQPPTALTLPYIIRRTRSTPSPMNCRVCKKNGHQTDNCIQRGPIICMYCQEVNDHVRKNCPVWKRDQ